jgi:hypothetical protein
MARRRAGKADSKSATPRPGGRRAKAKADAATPRPRATAPAANLDANLDAGALRERLAAVERERDMLRAALDEERTRRLALEEVHAATRDRITWALDSLQAILDARA